MISELRSELSTNKDELNVTKDEHEQLELPVWVGEEVTGMPQYYNSNLTYQPVSEWPETQ